jgi:hypothetical protein
MTNPVDTAVSYLVEPKGAADTSDLLISDSRPKG